MKEYLARFYDDDKTNFIGNNYENIECILIDPNKPNILIKKKKFHPQVYFYEYIKKNPYDLELIKLAMEHHYITYDEIPPNNGLEIEHMKALQYWCLKNKKKKKIVFFDWDKTLSVTNGFLALKKYSKKQLKEYLLYILGGKERFQKLQDLFYFLNKNNIVIYILTNNGTAVKHKNTFLDMIKLIDKKFISSHLLYGLKYNHKMDKNGKIIKSNKFVFLEKEFDLKYFLKKK
jgi:hypothetical protein